MKPRPRTSVPDRRETVRAALRQALRGGPLTARELSARVGVPEKQVAEHLEHLRRSLKATGEKLRLEPASCECGFTFRKRQRPSRPSRCPVCRSERLHAPRFTLVSA